MARPSPTCARIASTCSAMTLAVVQVGADAGEVVQEVLEHLLAVRGVHDLGVVLHPGEPAADVLERRDGRTGAAPRPSKPAGAGVTESPWLIHTGCCVGQAGEQRAAGSTTASRCGRTRGAGAARPCRRGPAPSPGSRSRCRTPGCPASNSAGSSAGAPSAYTLAGPPDSTIAAGSLARSPRRSWCAGRSRSTPWPRAPGGRSAARTGRRSRRRGRVEFRGHRPSLSTGRRRAAQVDRVAHGESGRAGESGRP